jgi:hypothetical protein
MAAVRAVDPQQQLNRLDVLGRVCTSACSATAISSAVVFAPALPGRNSPASASPV